MLFLECTNGKEVDEANNACVDPAFDYVNDCPVNSATNARDPSCLQCKGSKMRGAVRMDAIFLESLLATDETGQKDELLAQAKFNDNACSDAGLTFDATNKVFTFEIDLGKCGMTAATRIHESES